MSLRILFASDAPWTTSGYAVITKQQAPRLRDFGHDVALLTTYGLHGGKTVWDGMTVYPGGADPFANDVIGQAARDWKADIVITLKDSFVFRPDAFQGLRWVPMVPVDHDPLPPAVANVARAAYRPIAYAPNGFRALRAAGLDPLYVPHSYDPKVFYPVDKTEARRTLGIPDDLFIVGTVAVNRGGIPSRKAWVENIEAFGLFAKDKPNARYFLHTYLGQDGFEGSINLPIEAAKAGVNNKVLFCDQDKYKAGFPDEYLRLFYNSLDVLNAVSVGEGFGIPALEAQACGVPVIVGDWCAHEDLCFGGWKVMKGRGNTFPLTDNQGTKIQLPYPEAIAEQLERAYCHYHCARSDEFEYKDMNALALSGASAHALDHVMTEYWKPALEEIERTIRAETSRGVLRIITPQEVGVAA